MSCSHNIQPSVTHQLTVVGGGPLVNLEELDTVCSWHVSQI